MKRAAGNLCLLFFACFAGGCLEFKEQTMTYRYVKAADELRIFQDYRGIFGADADGKADVPLSGDEQEQLDSVWKGQRTFFFANWIFEYDREDLEGYRDALKDPEKTDLAAADRPKMEHLVGLVLDNVKVDNGPFYLDADGRLCGVQSVTVGKLSQIVAAVNGCTEIFLNQMQDENKEKPEDRKAVERFREDKAAKFLQQDGNALVLRWPMSRQSYDKGFGAKADDAEAVKQARAAGIGITWADDVATFSIGKADDGLTSITLPVFDNEYVPNAIAPATAKQAINKSFDPQAAAKKFLGGGEK